MNYLIQIIMKRLLLAIILSGFSTISYSQVNQITIYPSNPDADDTISVISDLSYYGNCTFGLVHYYSYLVGSVIHITPTYCGYGDSTFCNSIDTFITGPYPPGNYTISIDYHQGSVCPISGFDAGIAQFDTSLVIGTITTVDGLTVTPSFYIYQDPSNNYILKITGKFKYELYLNIFNISGQNVLHCPVTEGQFCIDVSSFNPGVYFVEIKNRDIYYRKSIIKL
jgi:hypothetical protein